MTQLSQWTRRTGMAALVLGLMAGGAFAQADLPANAPPSGDTAALNPNTLIRRTGGFLVFFDVEKSMPTPHAEAVLKATADSAKSGGNARVKVIGYVGAAGGDRHNAALSLRLASIVKQELVRMGVPAASIEIFGTGPNQPLALIDDGISDPQNRRVEILIN